MADQQERLVIDDQRGGRNGYDAAWALDPTECADAVNIDFYQSRLGRKRGGMAAPSTSGTTRTGKTSSLARHVPTTSETAAELWAVDDAATPIIERLAGGTVWSAPTLKDAPTGNGYDFTFASINSKLCIGYKTAQGRIHFWDGSTVRRGGLAATGSPTAADGGGVGAYGAILRYYRQRVTVQASGITVRRSEPSDYVSITPDGVHTQITVTRATFPNEGETHWELEASTDTFTWYRIATTVVGTTTYADSASTSSYSSNPLSALTGVYTLQKAYKFVAADQNRVLGFGSYTTTDKQNRIEISAVIGSLDIGDEERIDTTINAYIDLDENDSGVATGLNGPVLGAFLAFKDRQVWSLTATGNTAQPYRQEAISKSIGALRHQAIARGDDHTGNAAVYWMSHRGPYRWSLTGLQYIGKGVEDYVLGPTATINLAASAVVSCAVYHQDKRQVWFWWATGSSNDPNVGFIFDVQTEGWTRIPSGDLLASVRCAVMFANTLGATMSRDLKPYVGQASAALRLWKADTGTDDNGTLYQAYVLTRAFEPGGPGFFGLVGDAVLLAKASPGVTITDLITADFGAQTTIGQASLSPVADEVRVSVRLEDSAFSGVQFVQHQIGDAAPISNSWTLDRLIVPYEKMQAVSQ